MKILAKCLTSNDCFKKYFFFVLQPNKAFGFVMFFSGAAVQTRFLLRGYIELWPISNTECDTHYKFVNFSVNL